MGGRFAAANAMDEAFNNNPDNRLYFGMYDPNDLHFSCITVSVKHYFIAQNEGFVKKVLGLATVGVSVIIIFWPGHGVVSWVFYASAQYSSSKVQRIKISTKILIALAGAAVIAGYGYKVNMERYSSLSNVGSDYNVTSEEGRLGIWKKGISWSHPIPHGVGVNCFPKAIGELRAEMGEIPKWQAPHNSTFKWPLKPVWSAYFSFIPWSPVLFAIFPLR